MSVKSFECAIARSQIGRYLAGDPVGEEAMRQLETHIAACADCQRLIDSKREELLGPLAQAPTAQEAIAGATAVETLAASNDVAAIERELRAAAARSGRAVIETVEARELVGAVASVNSAMAGGNSNEGAPISSAPYLTVETGSAAPASSRPSLPKLGGIGAALGKVSLPKFVRDVPEPKVEAEVIPFGPIALAPEPQSSLELPAAQIKAKRSLTKAGVYAGALALVLGGMAYLGNPTALLGGKAAPIVKAETKPAAKPPAKKAIVAHATGIRHSALGVPITDAAAPVARGTTPKPAKSATKTLVAHAASTKTGDPADLGPLEFDSSLDAPAKSAAKPVAAKPSVAKPVAAKRVAGRIPVSVKPTPHVAKPIGIKPKAAKPILTKPKAHLATTRPATAHATSGGPVATVEAVPVAPAKAARPVVRKSRPIRRRAKAIRKTAPRSAPKNQNVIRVYDETGKPIN